MPRLCDILENCQRALANGVQFALRSLVTDQRIDNPHMPVAMAALQPVWVVETGRNHLVVHGGVLADIQRRQMKAESRDAAQQPLHRVVARMQAAIG